jgi:hypothetical protein
MAEQKNINDMDITTLKALAYDLIAQREQATQNLQAVNQVIARKSEPAVQPVKE